MRTVLDLALAVTENGARKIERTVLVAALSREKQFLVTSEEWMLWNFEDDFLAFSILKVNYAVSSIA